VSRRSLHFLALLAIACLWCGNGVANEKKKNKKDDETQTLQLPAELPSTISGKTRELTFHVTPLTGKGLLSAQIREGLKALFRDCHHETVLKIRAFVAGSGDVRRVRDMVSDVFTDRHQPLPVLTLIRAGALPMEGAQVVFEAIASGNKDVNPHGLALISAQVATADNPLAPVPPLSLKSLDALAQAVKDAGSKPADVVRVTCFLSSLDDLGGTRDLVASAYPAAAMNFVQAQRAPVRGLAACEAVARLEADPPAALSFRNSGGLAGEAGLSEIALVNAPEVLLTGSQVSFGYQEQDARLALQRFQKEVEHGGSSLAQVAFVHYYPLAPAISEQVRKLRVGFFNPERAPAGTMLLFEGLPSMDAGFAVDGVAVK
jgi:enamine deaminase RidA (YjgF/YER057c/UK114 family)